MLANALAYRPAGRPSGGRRSRSRVDRAGRSRSAPRTTSGCSSAPTTACCAPAIERFGGAAEAVDVSLSPVRLEPVSATFHGRDMFAPVAAHLALGRGARRTLGEPIDPAELTELERTAGGDRAGPARSRRPVAYVDRFGNVALDARARPARRRRPEARPTRLGRGRRAHARRRLRADVRRRRPRARCCSTSTPTAAWRWRSTAAAPPSGSGSQSGDRVVAAAGVMTGFGSPAPPPARDRLDQRRRPGARRGRRAERDDRHRRPSRPRAAAGAGGSGRRRPAGRCSTRRSCAPLELEHALLPLAVPLAVCEAIESVGAGRDARSSGPTTSGSTSARSPGS